MKINIKWTGLTSEALSVTYSGGSSLAGEIRTWLAKHGLVE